MNNALVGIAGVHHVVSELSRRGLIALPTVKNTAAYDIVAIDQLGTWHANIQVKTSSKRATFFLMPPPEKIRTGRHNYYVLARWVEAESRYECYLLRGREAREAIEATLGRQKASLRRGARLLPSIHIGRGDGADAMRWARAWKRWRL